MRKQNTSRKSEGGGRKSAFRRSVFTSAFSLQTSHFRLGTTLSEVLVSTLVMSIGVVTLATLFPISVLRSIQASQLTNAAILRYNAESQLRTVPEIINIGTEWQPSTNYTAGDTVVPTATTRQRFPVSAVFVCTAAGTSGPTEPAWITREGAPTAEVAPGTAAWSTILLKNYVVDPLGYLLVDSADANGAFRGTGLTGAQQHFGNVGGVPFQMTYPRVVNRFPAFGYYLPGASAALNEYRAAGLAILPDSWLLQGESLDLSYTANSTNITLGGVDGAQLADSVQYSALGLVPDRIVIFGADLAKSYTFPVTGVAGGSGSPATVSWSGAALPTGFVPGKARVESLERRYSYLLSIRQRRSYTYTDVVVFFRRNYAIHDEQVYSCVFRKIDRGDNNVPGATGDDDGDSVGDATDTSELGLNDDKHRNFCIVQYHSAGLKPYFKKGSYICDAHNMRWYRVIDATEPSSSMEAVSPSPDEYERNYSGLIDPTGTDRASGQPCDQFVRLTLDQEVLEDSPMQVGSAGAPFTPWQYDATGATVTSGGIVGGAILMRGVVDVFPLRPRSTWEQ